MEDVFFFFVVPLCFFLPLFRLERLTLSLSFAPVGGVCQRVGECMCVRARGV